MHIIKTQTRIEHGLKRMCLVYVCIIIIITAEICISGFEFGRYMPTKCVCHLCDAIELHTSKNAQEKNQHNKRRVGKKVRFVNKLFYFISVVFVWFYKRFIILNVNAPHLQSKYMWKEEKQKKKTEQKEFREKWKYNILSRVRTHSLSAQSLILWSILAEKKPKKMKNERRKKKKKHISAHRPGLCRIEKRKNECKCSCAHTHNVYNQFKQNRKKEKKRMKGEEEKAFQAIMCGYDFSFVAVFHCVSVIFILQTY